MQTRVGKTLQYQILYKSVPCFSSCFMRTDGQEDESGDPEGGDRSKHHSLSYTARNFHIAPDTAAIRHPVPTHIHPPIDT